MATVKIQDGEDGSGMIEGKSIPDWDAAPLGPRGGD